MKGAGANRTATLECQADWVAEAVADGTQCVEELRSCGRAGEAQKTLRVANLDDALIVGYQTYKTVAQSRGWNVHAKKTVVTLVYVNFSHNPGHSAFSKATAASVPMETEPPLHTQPGSIATATAAAAAAAPSGGVLPTVMVAPTVKSIGAPEDRRCTQA